jgi:hypothetical protein
MSLKSSFQESFDVSFVWSFELSDARGNVVSFGLGHAKSGEKSFDRSFQVSS